jgi:F420H(2)-dependent quinone reductase
MSLRIKTLSTIHREVYAASGGRLGRRIAGMPVLLLTTVGRKTGRRREVPLTYIEDDGVIVLVASYGGRAHNPAWFENLRANPAVEVAIAGDRRSMQARPATAGERARLWPRVVETYDGYAKYQAKTAREIPLVLLSPRKRRMDATAQRRPSHSSFLRPGELRPQVLE